MTRSLLLAGSFPPALGGVETLLYQTTRRLSDPPLVLAPAPARAPDMRVQQVPLGWANRAAYRGLWRLHPSLHYLTTFWQSAWWAGRAWRPRVIQVGHVDLAPLGWLLARRLDVPLVVYAYGQEVWRGGRRQGLEPLDRLLRGGPLATADGVLAPGSFTAGLLQAWQVPSQRVVCVPYGAEPLPVAPPEPPPGNVLLSVGRLVPRKGIDMVIRALPRLGPAVRYRVVGAGPDLERLRRLAQRCGVAEQVTFLGRLDAASLAEEYQRCTLFVLPSRRTAEGELEGYGLVYFEAAAWGRAVVAGRSGGEVDAVIDGETGVLVDAESPDAVSSAIGALLADPRRRQQLGVAGRRRVEQQHNWTSAARVVDRVLRELAP